MSLYCVRYTFVAVYLYVILVDRILITNSQINVECLRNTVLTVTNKTAYLFFY